MTPRLLARASRRAARGLFDAFAEIGGARRYPPANALAAAHRLAAAAGALARAHAVHVTVRGDVPRGPVLVVTHVAGPLDALALLPICPAIPIAPAAVLGWPVISTLATAFGVAFVTRADPMARVRTLRRVHALLAAGVSVVDYTLPAPGGAVGAVGELRRGGVGIAARLGLPVVPVAVRYAVPPPRRAPGTSLTRHYLDLAARPRVDIELVFGPPVHARAGEPAEVHADRVRHRLARMLRLGEPGQAQLRVA